jgi:hypothetical protein
LVQIIRAATGDELYWSEDLRPKWVSKLEALGWIPKPNVAGIANVLMCFDESVTVVSLMSFDFLSDLNMEGVTPKDNDSATKMTPKGKQAIKARPVRKSAAKAKEMVVEDEGTGKQDAGPPFDATKHVMNEPKVSLKVRNSNDLC